MKISSTKHIYPDDNWVNMEFCTVENGMFDDKSLGFLLFEDLSGDECHLPHIKSSTIVKFFSDFIEIEDVCREREHGNRASAETMENLRKIKKKLDKWLEPRKEDQ